MKQWTSPKLLVLPVVILAGIAALALLLRRPVESPSLPEAAPPKIVEEVEPPPAGEVVTFQVQNKAGRAISEARLETPGVPPSTTDSKGYARIGRPEKTTRITVTHPDFHPLTRDLSAKDSGPPLVITLSAKVTLGGRVFDLQGPISEAVVKCQDEAAMTDKMGQFKLKSLHAATVLVEIHHPAHLSKSLQLLLPEEGKSVEVEMLALDASISGMVFDESGSTLKDARVVANLRLDLSKIDRGGGVTESQWSSKSRGTLTDAEGRYHLAVPAGQAEIQVDREGYVQRAEVLEFEAKSQIRKEWLLRKGFSLDVHVRDSRDAPVQGATVRLSFVDSRRIEDPEKPREPVLKTDARGIASFSALKEGRYQAESDEGFDTVTVPQTPTVILRPRFARISGRLTVEGGIPAGGNALSLVSITAETPGEHSTSGASKPFKDEYRFEKLGPGTYAIHATFPPNKVALHRMVKLMAGENHLDLVLRPGALVEGRFVDDNGTGRPVLLGLHLAAHESASSRTIPITRLHVDSAGFSKLRSRYSSNSQGEFSIDGLPPVGGITISFYDSTDTELLKTVTVDGSTGSRINLGVLRK